MLWGYLSVLMDVFNVFVFIIKCFPGMVLMEVVVRVKVVCVNDQMITVDILVLGLFSGIKCLLWL